jgi:hypothetical protein
MGIRSGASIHIVKKSSAPVVDAANLVSLPALKYRIRNGQVSFDALQRIPPVSTQRYVDIYLALERQFNRELKNGTTPSIEGSGYYESFSYPEFDVRGKSCQLRISRGTRSGKPYYFVSLLREGKVTHTVHSTGIDFFATKLGPIYLEDLVLCYVAAMEN